MTNDEILQAAKDVGLTGLSLIDVGYLEHLAAIIEKRTIERCAVTADEIGDTDNGFGCAAAIRAME